MKDDRRTSYDDNPILIQPKLQSLSIGSADNPIETSIDLIPPIEPKWKQIRNRYLNLLHYHKEHPSNVDTKDITILCSVAAILLLIALVSYLTGGYHAGFILLNSLTPYIPEFILQNITVFGDGALLMPLMLLFFTRHIQMHWIVFVGAILCAILSRTLKNYFGFSRPADVLAPELIHIVGPAYKAGSFPSGHAMTAFAMASICFCMVKNKTLKYLFLIMAILVGFSRVLNGVHWFIDVLVGGALGIMIAVVAMMVTSRWRAGLSVYVHPFILFILILSCFIVYIDGNDYKMALPLMYTISVIALIQTFRKHILLVK